MHHYLGNGGGNALKSLKNKALTMALTLVILLGAGFFVSYDSYAESTPRTIDRTLVDFTVNADGTATITGHKIVSALGITEVIIPLEIEDEGGVKHRITKIGDGALSGAGLKKVVFGSAFYQEQNELVIGQQAFKNNPLAELRLPNNLISLGSEAFLNAKITTLDLSNCTKLTSIPTQAFEKAGIKNLVLPPNITAIGRRAFYENYITNEDISGEGAGKIKIPNAVTNIEYGAFGHAKADFDCSLHAPNSIKGAPWRIAYGGQGYRIIWNDEDAPSNNESPFYFDKNKNMIWGIRDDADFESGTYDCWDKETGTLTIPQTIGGYSVKMLAEYAIANGTSSQLGYIKKVRFENTWVDTVPDCTFRYMSRLTEVDLGPYVKSIGEYAFRNTGITNFNFEKITTIGHNAIISSNVDVITIGNDIQTINKEAFNISDDYEIRIDKPKDGIENAPWQPADNFRGTIFWNDGKATYPTGVATTDDRRWTFNKDTGMLLQYHGSYGDDVDLPVPAYVTSGGVAYKITSVNSGYNIIGTDKASFRKVTIPDGIETINNAFAYIKLGSVDFSTCTTLKTIKSNAFLSCGLTKFNIPDSVETLGARAFADNDFTGQITLSGNIKEIDNNVFSGCDGITSIKIKQYRNANSGAEHPVAEGDVKYNVPYGADAPCYFMDDPQPIPSHEVTTDAANNRVVISYEIYTSDNMYVAKDITASSDMPAVDVTNKPVSNGMENAATGIMRIENMTAGSIKGGNGTYTVKIKYGHGADAVLDDEVDYSVIINNFHSITYDANSQGRLLSGSVPVEKGVYVKDSQKANALDPNSVADPINIDGYAFREWNTKADGSGKKYPVGDNITMPDENITLYAQWDEVMIDVTLDGNGGRFAAPNDEQKVITGRRSQLLRDVNGYEIPTRAGYSFLGWSDDPDATEPDVWSVPDSEKILFAVWGKNIVTLTFDANGGNIEGSGASSISGYPGSVIVKPNPVRAGYTHGGWSTDKAGENDVSSDYMPNRNMTYYAKWEAGDNQVQFINTEHGTATPLEVTVKSGSAIGVTPSATANSGYVFTNRWISSEGGSFTSDEIKDYIVSGKNNVVTFTPQFVEEGKALIIYDFNGGTYEDAGVKIFTGNAGAPFEETLPVPEKTGYGYKWDGVKPMQFPGEGEAIIVKAIWSPADNTVKFDATTGGLTTTPDVTVMSGERVGVIPEATANDGYRFTGLWKSSEGGYFSPEQVRDYVVSGMNNEVIFTAQFELKTQSTILFNFNGGLSDGRVYRAFTANANDSFNPDDEPRPEYTGYRFEGWDRAVPDVYPAAGEIVTLNAIWDANENDVIFIVPEGGTLKSAERTKVESGQKVGVKPEVEIIAGYEFNNMWTSSEGGIFSTDQIADYAITGQNSEVRFTAMITKIQEYNIILSAGAYGNVEPASKKLLKGESISSAPIVTANSEYEFTGKWKCSLGGTYTTEELLAYKANGDIFEITFTAQFNKKAENTDPTDPFTGNSELQIDKKIEKITNDNDLPGSTFGLLQLRGTPKGNKKLKLNWTKPRGTVKYVLYGAKCGKTNKYKKIKTLSASKKTITLSKVGNVKVKKGLSYKFFIAAFDKEGKTIAVSKTLHVRTTGGKYGNYKSVKVTDPKNKKVTLKLGRTKTIKAKAIKKDKKVTEHRGIMYESSNPAVAKVGAKNGKIKAVGRGSCTIYVYAQSGQFAKIKVVVK